MKFKPTDKNEIPKITLPWLIIAIASMVMFFVFLISLYLNFYTAIFFTVWIWIIAGALIYNGINKRKTDKPVGNLNIIMGVIAFIGGVWILII